MKNNDDLVKSINNDIKYIFSELDVAKIDFSERAFSPFWNRIKNSLIALDNIDKTIKKQSILEKEYRYLLNGKPHNFPPLEFNINYEKIDLASKEVKKLTRSAEKDFQFAMIFEQKKIQDICVFGFRNMTESIYNIERSVRNGFRNIENCINKEIDGVSRNLEYLNGSNLDILDTATDTITILNQSIKDSKLQLNELREQKRLLQKLIR